MNVRYIVVRLQEMDLEEIQQEGTAPNIIPPVLAETRGQAESALQQWMTCKDCMDWAVFEVQSGGRTVQCSVVFKDGFPEIQS